MTLRLVDTGWGAELTGALRADTSALERLLALQPKSVEVITRFDLANFAEDASDLTALRRVLKAGGRVRGNRGLHTKLYLFGASRAIVTSVTVPADLLAAIQP